MAVGVGGDIVWAEGFGWADLENRVPVAPDMTFRIGTASTVLTSAAVGLLLEKQWPVTLRQLMAPRRQIFEPLGLDGTEADSATDPIPNRATLYFPRFAADPRYGPDLMRFGMAINSGALLQPATVQRLQTSQNISYADTPAVALKIAQAFAGTGK